MHFEDVLLLWVRWDCLKFASLDEFGRFTMACFWTVLLECRAYDRHMHIFCMPVGKIVQVGSWLPCLAGSFWHRKIKANPRRLLCHPAPHKFSQVVGVLLAATDLGSKTMSGVLKDEHLVSAWKPLRHQSTTWLFETLGNIWKLWPEVLQTLCRHTPEGSARPLSWLHRCLVGVQMSLRR